MKKQINWDCSKKENELITKIVNRACEGHKVIIKIDLSMDIVATHCNGTKLDLEKFFAFDDFNFYHDIFGIMRYINRTTGKLDNCFLPRCSE